MDDRLLPGELDLLFNAAANRLRKLDTHNQIDLAKLRAFYKLLTQRHAAHRASQSADPSRKCASERYESIMALLKTSLATKPRQAIKHSHPSLYPSATSAQKTSLPTQFLRERRSRNPLFPELHLTVPDAQPSMKGDIDPAALRRSLIASASSMANTGLMSIEEQNAIEANLLDLVAAYKENMTAANEVILADIAHLDETGRLVESSANKLSKETGRLGRISSAYTASLWFKIYTTLIVTAVFICTMCLIKFVPI